MFNPPVPRKEKEISHHPWERYILDKYADQMKYAHNSIYNPEYPLPKTKDIESKQRIKERIKFTVIGNRVNKEFIHCTQLVKGLHKYRPKEFDAPVIRGVTGVEWPMIWNDLKIRYGGAAFCINNPVAVLINERLLGGDTELKELIAQKYSYHLSLDYYKLAVQEFARFVNSSGKPCAYIHISINNKHVGTFIFMLYADLVPQTCDNFLRLCHVTKGGYSGTPVHRIVKDSWIQCGGFGLKSSDLKCENFIVPHDRRGVLCMANDGRHIDCSTQFFVLLQPQPWMAHKYVAFGQLIDGEETLKKIEDIPTFYEAPKSEIIMNKAGILNLECRDITINKMTNAYLHKHVENLIALGKLFWGELEDKVFELIAFRRAIWKMVYNAAFEEIQRIFGPQGQSEAEDSPDDARKDIHATQRFMRKKSDLQQHATEIGRVKQDDTEDANNDFDVEEYTYSYEPEEYNYSQVTPPSESIEVLPEKNYYLPFTDVPYPGEVDSDYNLLKFLKGNYCLGADLIRDDTKKLIAKVVHSAEVPRVDSTSSESLESVDSDDEREIRRYLRLNADRVSFAGNTIKKMAKHSGMLKMHDIDMQKLSDDSLTKNRRSDFHGDSVDEVNIPKKVSIAVPTAEEREFRGIRRRQTGFAKAGEQIKIIEIPYERLGGSFTSTHSSRKVRITVNDGDNQSHQSVRRPTGFVRLGSLPSDDDDDNDVGEDDRDDEEDGPTVPMQMEKPSVLKRLLDEVKVNVDSCYGPTLKDYTPLSEYHQNFLLTRPDTSALKNEDDRSSRNFLRPRASTEASYEPMMSLQHGKKFGRKISSDYVKTIDQAEHKTAVSLRSIEYAKTRPTMSVEEYQKRNQRYQATKQVHSSHSVVTNTVLDPPVVFGTSNETVFDMHRPGDTPAYSLSSTSQKRTRHNDTWASADEGQWPTKSPRCARVRYSN